MDTALFRSSFMPLVLYAAHPNNASVYQPFVCAYTRFRFVGIGFVMPMGPQFPTRYEPICILRWPRLLLWLHRWCGCRLMIESAAVWIGSRKHGRIINLDASSLYTRSSASRDCVSACTHANVRGPRIDFSSRSRVSFLCVTLLRLSTRNRIDWCP